MIPKLKNMTTREIDRNTIELKLYGYIGYWAANGENFSALIESLESKGYKNLVLRLHSGGGSIIEGNIMYNTLLNSKMHIKIVIDGLAASMASIIILAANEVEIADNALVMVHRPRGYADGNADEILSTAKLLGDLEGVFIKRYSERTGMSAADIQSKYLNGADVWLNANEAVAAGFATKVIPATAKDIKTLDAAINNLKTADVYNRFAASLNVDTNTIQIKAELIKKYNLQGVSASSTDADIIAALDAKMQQNAESGAITAELDAAVTAKLITDDERKTYQEIGEKTGITAMRAVLPKATTPSSQEPQSPQLITDLIQNAGNTSAIGAKNWDWFQKNDPQALEKMQLEKPEQFAALYKAEYGVEPAK